MARRPRRRKVFAGLGEFTRTFGCKPVLCNEKNEDLRGFCWPSRIYLRTNKGGTRPGWQRPGRPSPDGGGGWGGGTASIAPARVGRILLRTKLSTFAKTCSRIRITEQGDARTRRGRRRTNNVCSNAAAHVLPWASIPYTGGSPPQRITIRRNPDQAQGVFDSRHDAGQMIDNFASCARVNDKRGGHLPCSGLQASTTGRTRASSPLMS